MAGAGRGAGVMEGRGGGGCFYCAVDIGEKFGWYFFSESTSDKKLQWQTSDI